jgi:hypothetical protein
MQNFEKMAALGAQGAAGGLIVAWLGFSYFIRPVSTGGMDSTLHLVAIAASGMVFGLMSAAHLWFGMQLKNGADSIRG